MTGDRHLDGAEWQPRTLFEAAAKHRQVRVMCRCKRSVVVNAHALWWYFHRKGWPMEMHSVAARLRCEGCGKKRATVVLTRQPVTVDRLPLPPEREWKRAVDRYRC